MAIHRILGISIGTTKVGIAVLEGTVILEWGMKCFNKPWSPQKLQSIISHIEQYIIVHEAKHVAIKIPALHAHTSALRHLLHSLEQQIQTKEIILMTYSISDLKKHWNGHEKTTKTQLMKTILEKQPKFKKEYNREMSSKIKHYEKLFEAIGVTFMVQQHT